MSISIIYNTSTESNVTREFNTADELKSFISNNKANFTGAMKVVCDNGIIKDSDCHRMFSGCSNITSIDLSEFDTANAINMSYMFDGCKSLTSLDLSNFNTSNATSMRCMFFNCSSLTSLDLSNFNTSKVTDMSNMFSYCSSLTSLDLSNFDTSKVTDMSYMFGMCQSLTSLDLSNFDTSKVTNMDGMFDNCNGLKIIYCEQDWKTDKITSSTNMFFLCSKLKGAISYDSAKIDINYANPDTGYFSYLPSRKFLVNLNMDQNEIKNMLLDKRNTAPDLPAAGQIYYNTTDKKIYIYNGTEWIAGSGFKSSLSLVEAQPYESPEVI